MTASPSLRPGTWIGDPDDPTHALKPNADGSLNVTGSFSATTSAKATAAAPTYVEGSTDPLSMDLNGGLRVTGTISASTSAHATAAAPSYVEGSDDPLSVTLAGSLRVSNTTALPAGTAIIGKVGIDQTTPGTTNAVSATNFPTTVSTGTGAQGASSPRVTIATDTATVAGSASIPAGTNLMGKVGIDQTTPGTTNAVSADLAKVNGAAVNVGTGAASTGTQRVTTSTDSTIATVTTVSTVTNVATIGTSVTPGTAAANLGKAEDAVHSSGDTGVFALHVANEAQTTLAADGDYIANTTDTKGNSLTVGNLAHDAVDAGNPLKVGGQARTTNPTAVADADRVNFIADKLGKQISVSAIRDMKGKQFTTITSSTSETTILTAVASTFLDLYGLILANKSATATNVSIRDATGGSVFADIYVPAGETRGFMLDPGGAIPQATVNNNWTAQCGTSVDSLYVTALYVRNT